MRATMHRREQMNQLSVSMRAFPSACLPLCVPSPLPAPFCVPSPLCAFPSVCTSLCAPLCVPSPLPAPLCVHPYACLALCNVRQPSRVFGPTILAFHTRCFGTQLF